MSRTTSSFHRLAATLAVVTFASGAFAKGVSVEAATAEQSAAASDKYRAGADALDAGKLEDALALFRESYDVVASPNSHLMIARVLSRMGKSAEAFAEIESTIEEADAAASKSDKYKKTAQTARTEKEDLSRKVGFVVVSVPGTVTVGGTSLESPELGRLVVNPGHNEVVLTLPGGAEAKRAVDVTAGNTARVVLRVPESGHSAAPVVAPAPAAECPPPRVEHTQSGIDQRTLAYVAGGVSALGFATFAVFGVLNNGKYDDLESNCSGGVCSRDLASDAETGRTYQTLANVGLGVGIVGLVTGATLFFTAPSRPRETVLTVPTTRVAVGAGTVSVQGRF